MKIEKSQNCKIGESVLKQLNSNSKKKILLEFKSQYIDDLRFIQEVGSQISQQNHLTELSLIFQKNTNLKEEGWGFLFRGVQQLNQLESLEVHVGKECFLGDKGLHLLMDSLSSLVNIKKLSIVIENANFISSTYLKKIYDCFQHLPKMNELKVQILEQQTEISEEKMNLFTGFHNLKQIQRLDLSIDLSYNNESDIDDFFSALISLNKLTYLTLYLDYNQQEFDFIEKLTFYLQQLVQLKELILGFKQKVKEDSPQKTQIFTFFRNLKNLEIIDLSQCINNCFNNDIYYESLSYLPNLRNLSIQILDSACFKQEDFSSNRINSLKNKNMLQSLSVVCRFRSFTDEAYQQLNQGLQQNKQIESLQLILNQIQKESQSLALYESLNQLQYIQQLEIQFNLDDRTTKYLNQILKGIGNISTLKNLKISFYVLLRKIRNEQLSLQNLKELNLSIFQFQINQMVLDREFQELGQVLQNQKNLQNLKLVIKFQEQNSFEVQEKDFVQQQFVNDFVKGIKSLHNLKELQYQIYHTISNKELNPVLECLQYLTNLEKLNVIGENNTYYDEQLSLLSNSIFYLKQLKHLNLQRIKLKSLSNFYNQNVHFQNLSNLEQLALIDSDLSANFTGKDIEQLFFNLVQLKNLSLTINISEDDHDLFQDIAKGLSHLKNLENLMINLGQYQFTDQSSYYFTQACSRWEVLEDLTICRLIIDNQLTLNGVKLLRKGFQSLQKLKMFKCSFSVPTIEFSIIVQDFFTNMPQLNNLKIRFEAEGHQNQQNSEDQKNQELVQENKNMKELSNSNITVIDCNFNYCYKQQAYEISKFYEKFVNLQNLVYLNITHNWDTRQINFEKVEFQQIFKNLALSFQYLKNLQFLQIELKSCSFNFEEIPIQNMKYLSNLNDLILHFEKTIIHSNHILFDQLKYLKRLQRLSIFDQQNINENAAVSLGNSLQHLKMIQNLRLSFFEDCLIQSGVLQIGEGIGYLKYLTKLNICLSEFSNINDNGIKKLSEGISKIHTLQEVIIDISNNNLTNTSGKLLVSSLRKKKFLQKMSLYIKNQGQEFLEEISSLLYESKLLKQIHLTVSFNEQLTVCPDNLKTFFSENCGQIAELSVDNSQFILTKIYSKSQEGEIKFLFRYNQSLINFTPKVEIELLKNLQQNKKIILDFRLSENQLSNNKILSVQEQIKQLKVSILKIKFSFFNFSEHFLHEITFPALKNQNLKHFSLALTQITTQEINDEVFVQIGKRLNQLSLISLELKLNITKSQNKLYSDYYKFILKQLKDSQTLQSISLYTKPEHSKIVRQNIKHIKKIVKFQLNQGYW